MQRSLEEDILVKKQLAKIKWMYGFTCKRCHSATYYRLKDYSRKCAKCKRKESPTAQTAFDGLRLPVSTAVDILLVTQHRYYHFTYGLPGSSEALYYKNGYLRSEEFDNLQQNPLRFSSYDIEEEFELHQSTAWNYLNRVIEWMPKSYWRPHPGHEIKPAWFQSVRKENRPRYYALFNLLYTDGVPRKLGGILHLLVHKRKNSFLDDGGFEEYD